MFKNTVDGKIFNVSSDGGGSGGGGDNDDDVWSAKNPSEYLNCHLHGGILD